MCAFELFSQSIAFAPKNSEEMSLAYASQSEVLFHREKFEQCLQAIETCLSLDNYPEEKC